MVALDEPFRGEAAIDGMMDAPSRFLASQLAGIRRDLLLRGQTVSVHVGGVVKANRVTGGRRRRSIASYGEVRFAGPLSRDFLLVVKQCALFTAQLEELRGTYPCFAVIRNPVALLCSWSTVPFPVRHGRLPDGEALVPDLAARLDAVGTLLDRQLVLLDWFFHQYRGLPKQNIIRYEDIAQRGPTVLDVIAGGRRVHARIVGNRDAEYRPRDRQRAMHALLDREGAWWNFYSREDVEESARS